MPNITVPMTVAQAQISSKRINIELFNLTPSSIIELFEIDLSNLYFDQSSNTDSTYEGKNIFRFHSNLKLNNAGTKSNNIVWRGDTFFAIPIQTKGFEFNSKGTIPTPTLSLVVNDEGIPKLVELKAALRQLGDLTGGQVKRYKTFAKFLDAENWEIGGLPNGYTPDPYAYLTEDVYFIDRKIADNKNALEYELTSLANFEGIRIPARPVLADRCPFTYRGEGCNYEYRNRKNETEHGSMINIEQNAPPVATRLNEKIVGDILPSNTLINDRDEFNQSFQYKKGDCFYITKDFVNYYYVVIFADNVPVPAPFPPNDKYYVKDECSKSLRGCRLRYQTANYIGSSLPFGGFPAVNKVAE
jgi:lambda family phage minor tail protein L